MVSSRTPNRPVAIWVITWSLKGTRFSGKPPSPVQVKVFHIVALCALETIVGRLTDPKDMPPPYTGVEMTTLTRPSFLRFRGISVEISDLFTFLGCAGNLNRNLSKPPPELPTLYS